MLLCFILVIHYFHALVFIDMLYAMWVQDWKLYHGKQCWITFRLYL